MDAEFVNDILGNDSMDMVVFMGQNEHSIDGKGRLIVPSQFRKDLGPKFVIARGVDKCLCIYTKEKFLQIAQTIKANANMTPQQRMFVRIFFATAEWCEIDKQGRILVPSNLREYAGIEKDVISIGCLERIEIWDRKRYLDMMSQESDSQALAKSFGEMGISM